MHVNILDTRGLAIGCIENRGPAMRPENRGAKRVLSRDVKATCAWALPWIDAMQDALSSAYMHDLQIQAL